MNKDVQLINEAYEKSTSTKEYTEAVLNAPYNSKTKTGVKTLSNGIKEWWKNGLFHRDNDMPAIERADGSKQWYKNGELHRDNDMPAYVGADGTKSWYKNGQLHRDNDMPAIVRADGSKEWCKNDKFIRKETPFQGALRELGIDL